MAKRILVIEDNPVNMELVTDLLEANGFEFLTAMTAEEGIRLAEAELPDLVLMDIQLPGMDGLQATEHLKNTPKTRAIPIVALTAHAMKGDEDRALAVGCIGYITKPINTRSFPRLVAEFSEREIDPFAALPVAEVAAAEALAVEELSAAPVVVAEMEPVVVEDALEPVAAEGILEPVALDAALEPEPVQLEVVPGEGFSPEVEAPPVLELVDAETPAPATLPAFGGRRRKKPVQFAAASAPRFLVVDDDEINREMLSAMLRTLGYEADLAISGPDALEKLDPRHDMVLLDYMMPLMDGVEVCRRIREESRFNDLPIIMVTALSGKDDRLRAVEAGANDWICKPVDRTELQVRASSLLKMKRAQDALKQHQRDLEEAVRGRTAELRKALNEVRYAQEIAHRSALDAMQRMAFLAEFREGATAAAHIRCVALYCTAIARGLNMSPEQIENIQYASQVHDIGLLALSEDVVAKKGSRDEYEESVYRQHTILGARLLSGSQSDLIRGAEAIALSHHERWDGRGFPQGLAGEEIPLYGRILAVADTFDEWTAYQFRKRSLSNDEALAKLKEESGKAFDPRVVDAFFARWDEIERFQRQFRRTEEPPDDLPVASVAYAM